LVEQGFPGAILFSMLWLWVLKSFLVARRWASTKRPLLDVSVMAATCSGLAVVFVGGQFADFLKSEVMVWLLALLAGLRLTPVFAPSEPTPRAKGARIGSPSVARHRGLVPKHALGGDVP